MHPKTRVKNRSKKKEKVAHNKWAINSTYIRYVLLNDQN